MNQLTKQLLCLTALMHAVQLIGETGTTPMIVPRSQSFNAARQMIGWNNPEWGINRYPEDKYYCSLNLTFEYTRTFKDKNLTRALFGDSLTCGPCDDLSINISGSAVTDRGQNAWLADYFGLPRNFQSTVSFKPSISNFILDFSLYAGLDAWVDGMYFRVHSPFVHTKWNLNALETIYEPSNSLGSYFQGYFSATNVPTENLNTGFLKYTSGYTPNIINSCCNTPTYDCYAICPYDNYTGEFQTLDPIIWQPLCVSRIQNGCDCNGLTRNGFAEIRMVLGYNFLDDVEEEYHAGLGIYAAAPTGTRVGDQDDCNSKGRYLFEPVIGNGKHWELGAQVTAHHIWWRSEDDSKSLGLYLEANVTHLFAADQTRCFDLYSAGSNSRYMLAEYLTSNNLSIPQLNNETDTLGLQFANEYAPVANLTQRNVKTSVAVQGDIAVTLAYQSNNFQWDIGYNFWGRTCENICIDNCCPTQVGNWALKGDQRVYGFAYDNADNTNTPVTLAATDSRATIYTGSNMANGVSYTEIDTIDPHNILVNNLFADNPVLAVTTVDLDVYDTPHSDQRINTSNPPIFIQESDFDLTGTRGTSNKVFTNFNWQWDYCEDSKWTPYASIGGEVEFGATSSGCCSINDCETGCQTGCGPCGNGFDEATNTCNVTPACTALPRRTPVPTNCVDCAISQWGVWFKVGASYN